MSKIRLSCMYCDTTDGDGIKSIQAAERSGWQDIQREQTYAQACKTYEDWDADIDSLFQLGPPGFSVFDWFTHLGTCPECAAEFSEGEHRRAASEGLLICI